MLLDDKIMLSDKMLSVNIMLSVTYIFFFSWKLHTLDKVVFFLVKMLL
jgi:hypothetical protein